MFEQGWAVGRHRGLLLQGASYESQIDPAQKAHTASSAASSDCREVRRSAVDIVSGQIENIILIIEIYAMMWIGAAIFILIAGIALLFLFFLGQLSDEPKE
jgi:hypothetical protein